MNLLQVRDLRKSYKRGFIPRRNEVLKGVSFSVPAGIITGFLGGNGAAKPPPSVVHLVLIMPTLEAPNFLVAHSTLRASGVLDFYPSDPIFTNI